MTDGDVSLWRFVIENFGCIPRHLKERITAKEWQQIIIVRKKGFLGVDRRDMSTALAARKICASMSGKEVPLEGLLPVKLWEQQEQTPDEMFLALSSAAVKQDGNQHSDLSG